MRAELLEKIIHARKQARAVVMISHLDTHTQYLYSGDGEPDADSIPAELSAQARQLLKEDRSRLVETAGGQVFFHVFNTPLRMLIVGAVHIAQHLARMATMCGYEVTVIDPRKSFASRERFPGISLNTAWPDDALRELAVDGRTAIVTLSHDPKLDDPALAAALQSDAFYIGALGSRKTQAGRRQRLGEKGFSEEQQLRISGPVGLDIGARTPAEIALSIMAQVTEKRCSAAD